MLKRLEKVASVKAISISAESPYMLVSPATFRLIFDQLRKTLFKFGINILVRNNLRIK